LVPKFLKHILESKSGGLVASASSQFRINQYFGRKRVLAAKEVQIAKQPLSFDQCCELDRLELILLPLAVRIGRPTGPLLVYIPRMAHELNRLVFRVTDLIEC